MARPTLAAQADRRCMPTGCCRHLVHLWREACARWWNILERRACRGDRPDWNGLQRAPTVRRIRPPTAFR